MLNRISALFRYKTAESRLAELDTLRGIAAIMVLLLHFGIFKYGGAGVDLFFIISGFVIFMSIERSRNFKTFWRSRFVRLYPSYWLSIAIAVFSNKLFHGFFLPTSWKYVVGNLTMLQPLFRTRDMVGTYWTLYVELLFYILISLTWYFNKIKNINGLISIGLVVVIATNGIHLIIGDSVSFYTRFFIIIRAIIPLLSHLQLFSAGIIFFLCYKNGFDKQKVILLLVTILATAVSHKDSVVINHSMSVIERVICNSIFYLVFLLIISGNLKFFKIKALTTLGTISYPLYLVHQSFGLSFSLYLVPYLGKVFAMLVGILAAFILAFVITYCFDIPIRKKLKPKASVMH